LRQSVVWAVEPGKLVVKSGDCAWDAQGCVEGLSGKRHRGVNRLTSFAVDDTVHVARADSETAKK